MLQNTGAATQNQVMTTESTKTGNQP
jgi:hypothetical protein